MTGRSRFVQSLPALVLSLLAAPLAAQPRAQFPTTVPGGSATIAPNTGGASTFENPAFGGAAYSGGNFNAGTSSPVITSPPATFQGGINTWDPYCNNCGPIGSPPLGPDPNFYEQPSALFPETGGFDPGGSAFVTPDGGVHPWPRLFRDLYFEYTWLPGDGRKEFDLNKFEIATTMQLAFFYNQAPLEVTPGFAVDLISTQGAAPPLALDPLLPSKLYSAYIDTAWKPRITNWLSADLGVRVGVYSDFDHVNTDSIRIMGRGLGVLSFSPTLDVALGVVYGDRLAFKLLPAGGVIWTPDDSTRYEILFPRPKLAHKFTTLGTTDVWWYFGGEYGGDQWTFEFDAPGGVTDVVDYFDIRVFGGIEWFCHSGVRGWIEAGYVFDREVDFRTVNPFDFKPTDTIMLRAGTAY